MDLTVCGRPHYLASCSAAQLCNLFEVQVSYCLRHVAFSNVTFLIRLAGKTLAFIFNGTTQLQKSSFQEVSQSAVIAQYQGRQSTYALQGSVKQILTSAFILECEEYKYCVI